MTAEHLRKALEELGKKELKDFKWHLRQGEVNVFTPISWSKLENADITDILNLMEGAYTIDGAQPITERILEKIYRNDLVKELKTHSGSEKKGKDGVSPGPPADSSTLDEKKGKDVVSPGPPADSSTQDAEGTRFQGSPQNSTKPSKANPRLDPDRSWFRQYACDLTLDPNTANRDLSLSEGNRKVTCGDEKPPCPNEPPERFDYWEQVLCREGLTGPGCYWEVEWREKVSIGVTYRGIHRKGRGEICHLGGNNRSWSLDCNDSSYNVRYNGKKNVLLVIPSGSTRVGVYLDCPGGTLSFYRVSSGMLTLLHTFNSTFTEALYPGFRLLTYNSVVSLCKI